MTDLHIIGDSGKKRKSMYDPNLAERINKEVAEEIRRKELEEKLKKKKQPKQEPTITTPPPILTPTNLKYSFLEGDFGSSIFEQISKDYKDFPVITSNISYENNIVKGSKPYFVIAVNEILEKHYPQFRTATQADLEKILKANKLPLQGHYEDSSLVLRAKQEPNKYLAENLFKQFKDRGITLKENSAYVILLHTLKLRADLESQYKLSFDITDLTLNNYFEAPILNSNNGSYINPDEMDEKIGLPTKVYASSVLGNRQLWTRDSGLVGLYLYEYLDMDASDGGLADSDALGRVVIVSAEGTTQNFSSPSTKGAAIEKVNFTK